MSDQHCDVVVVGAGIAGASVAYELAADIKVVVIEMEDQPGYHTTGRSAALFSETYGPAPIRALSRYARSFFENAPAIFGAHPLLTPRGVLLVARDDQMGKLNDTYGEIGQYPGISRVAQSDLATYAPLLHADYAAGGILEQGAQDIDVHALHQGYLRGLRERGGKVVCGAELSNLRRQGEQWEIRTRGGAFTAPVVVNAAGAWADVVARMAGAEPVGLVPKRRTALIVAAPDGHAVDNWPLAVDVDEEFYMKPDAGRLLISPADETPSEPCDAQPEELDIAICVDRIERAFDLRVGRIQNSWAGLRSFVADHHPVCGYDASVDGFFWLAGQGGYGIQTAPGLSQLAAALVLGRAVPDALIATGFELSDVTPSRAMLVS